MATRLANDIKRKVTLIVWCDRSSARRPPSPSRRLFSPVVEALLEGIVLLDEAGKLFERTLSARIVRHLCEVGPDLSDALFGFREGHATIDAMLRLRAVAGEAVGCGSLPFNCTGEAVDYHEVPDYLR